MDWPAGLKARPLGAWQWPVTARRKPSQFSAPMRNTASLLATELRHLQARDTILRLDIREGDIRQDGAPYARAVTGSPAVVVQFDTPTGPLAFPCDRFTTWQDNLRAVALALEALRRVDRYGVTARAEQYTGFRAIEAAPSAAFGSRQLARAYLWRAAGLKGAFGLDEASDEKLGRLAQGATHPDRGGDAVEFARVRSAIDYLKSNPAP